MPIQQHDKSDNSYPVSNSWISGKGHPLFGIWTGICNRCNPAYKNRPECRRYSGRGIKVCDRWRRNFWSFAADMGPRPSPAHSIDRINNDGDYEPGNCRWATKAEQRRNSCAIHLVTAHGRTQHVMDWARETGLGVQTILRRLQRGWEPERAVTHIGWASVFGPRKGQRT